jgi:signal transduction histidine kinase
LQAKQEERNRLIEDVHDGFGSQLQTARLLIAHTDLTQVQLLKLVDECVNDLHLVVDLLGGDEVSLADAIIDYRHRLQIRLKGIQCSLQWDIKLQKCPKLPDRVILQVLRILQEAVNNSLIHSAASNIMVSASVLPNEILQLSVVDDGCGFPADPKKGRGLTNMMHRAKIIQAEILYTANSPRGTGTNVELTLDLARVYSDSMSKMNLEMQRALPS